MMMKDSTVDIAITINNEHRIFSVKPEETLLSMLRKASYFSVKSGCDDGTCGLFKY